MKTRIMIFVVAVLFSAPVLAAWSTAPLPQVSTTGLCWGDALPAINWGVGGPLLGYQIGTYADNGATAPFRNWRALANVALDDQFNICTFGSEATGEVLRAWIQLNDDAPFLMNTMRTSYTLASFQNPMFVRPVSYSVSPTEMHSPVKDHPASSLPTVASVAYSMTDDLSALNLDVTARLYPQYASYGSAIVQFMNQTVKAPPSIEYTFIYTPEPMTAKLWFQTGDNAPVLAALARVEGSAEAWGALWIRTKYLDSSEGVNPGGASLSGGTGSLAYGENGYGAGPQGGVWADTVVTISDFSLDGTYATLRLFYQQADVVSLGIDESQIRAWWWEDASGAWILAGNEANNAKNALAQFVLGQPTTNLGDWGLDMEGNYTWANIDHASTYGVGATPEPASLVLLALGGLALLWRRRQVPA